MSDVPAGTVKRVRMTIMSPRQLHAAAITTGTFMTVMLSRDCAEVPRS